MRKQTVWLLVILVGSYAVFLIVPEGQFLPFERQAAQVGITVGVAPNPYNTLDAQLSQRQDQLNREAANLNAQEEAFASSSAQADPASSPMIWYLAAALGIVAFLVLINFYFDWRRNDAQKEVHLVVPSEPEKPKE